MVNMVKNGQIWLKNGKKQSQTFKNRQKWSTIVNTVRKGKNRSTMVLLRSTMALGRSTMELERSTMVFRKKRCEEGLPWC